MSSPSKSSEENLPTKSSEENSPTKSSVENLPAKSSEENSPPKSSEENLPAKSSEENSPKKSSEEDSPAKEGEAAKSSEENSPANSWQSVIGLLNHYLFTWKKNYVGIYLYLSFTLLLNFPTKNVLFQVPLFLVQKIFSQTFQYINVQLFNR